MHIGHVRPGQAFAVQLHHRFVHSPKSVAHMDADAQTKVPRAGEVVAGDGEGGELVAPCSKAIVTS